MPQTITFLGKGGTGKTTIAIAAAKQQAARGKRVLLVGTEPAYGSGALLGVPLTASPQTIAANLDAMWLQTTAELESGWEEVKKIESRYLRAPVLNRVYGQELGILPGFSSVVALNRLRLLDASNRYDTIVFDGTGDLNFLHGFGAVETMSWYLRRFAQVIETSDLWRAISPILQPAAAAILTMAWTGESVIQQPFQEAMNFLESTRQLLSEPRRVVAYLVTDGTDSATETALYLWGSSQQCGLSVAGTIVNRADGGSFGDRFQPLPTIAIPMKTGSDWGTIVDTMPDLSAVGNVPKPIEFDVTARQVKLFLPGLDKSQVKLTQSAVDVTIEAGDCRRNIFLPPSLSGSSVKGAKFQNGYLIVSF